MIKGIGCLEDIFLDTNSIKHNRVLNLYTSGTQVNTSNSDKPEDITPHQLTKGVNAGTIMTYGRTDHNI